MEALSHKSKQFLSFGIKLLVLIIAFFIIWQQITKDFDILFAGYKANIHFILSYSNIAILLLLSFFNWFFEILKWQTLVSHCRKLTLKSSSIQVLKGHLTAFVTPAKIGEYGAKAMCYPSQKRKQIVFLNFLGNMLQMMITTIFGVIGMGLLIAVQFQEYLPYYLIILITGILIIIILHLVTARSSLNYKGYSWQRLTAFLGSISTTIKTKALLFSLIRYLIFSHQFYFMLTLFNVPISYEMGMALITTIYLISSLLPMLQFFDVVIKGGVAIVVFRIVGANEFTILLITSLMWFLNIVIPMIPASYFWITHKLVNSKTLMTS